MDAEKPFGERKENSYGRVMDHHNSLQKEPVRKVSPASRSPQPTEFRGGSKIRDAGARLSNSRQRVSNLELAFRFLRSPFAC